MTFIKQQAQRGFTLLELLVAIAIFGIIGVLATGGLSAILDQSAIANDALNRLNQVQRSVRFITNDLNQLHPRSVRDELGSGYELPVVADGQNVYLLRFSREGWRNPAGLPRSTQQRVQYRLEDKKLYREHWVVMDRSLGLEPVALELLDGVETIEFEFLDFDDVWQQQWPPVKPGGQTEYWPRAIRVTFELEGTGSIQRLIEVAG